MSAAAMMAALLALHDADLGDERVVIDVLAREFPVQQVHAHLEEAIDQARELRTGTFEVALW